MRVLLALTCCAVLGLGAPADASGQLGSLLRGLGKAAKGAKGAKLAKGAGVAGKAGTASKVVTAGHALAAGSLAFSEARAGRLFASLGDDAVHGASYVSREGDALRVFSLDEGAQLQSRTTSSLASVEAGAGDVYLDVSAQLHGRPGALSSGRLHALDARGNPHPVRRVEGEDGVWIDVVETGGEVLMELGQYGMDAAANGPDAEWSRTQPVRLDLLLEPACAQLFSDALRDDPAMADVDRGLLAPDGQLATFERRLGVISHGLLLVLVEEHAGALGALIDLATRNDHELIALSVDGSCDVAGLRALVQEVVGGRAAGTHAPLLAALPFVLDEVDAGARVVARGRPRDGHATPLREVAWVLHVAAQPELLADAPDDEDGGGIGWLVAWLVRVAILAFLGWKLYGFARFLRTRSW